MDTTNALERLETPGRNKPLFHELLRCPQPLAHVTTVERRP